MGGINVQKSELNFANVNTEKKWMYKNLQKQLKTVLAVHVPYRINEARTNTISWVHEI